MEVKSKLSAQWWWFDTQANSIPRKSPWLHSTLAELDEKTEAMLKLIEEDADSFAKRAEMYYKKRPELITIVEDLYRAHRSLAEKYDQVKFESGNRHLTPWTSCPSPLSKFRTSLSVKESEKSYDSYSESLDFDHDYYDSDDSVVIDDFEQQQEQEKEQEQGQEHEDKGTVSDKETKQIKNLDEEMVNLRKEIDRLREENKIQKEQMIQKDEEKKEAIRQLSFSVDFLKQENLNLKSRFAKDSYKKQTSSSPFEFTKLKGVFWGMFGDATTAVPI